LAGNIRVVQVGSLSDDDELLARLKAPPDLGDGVESLVYWRRRRERLPWYRLGARREAARMVVVWERRVRRALLQPVGPPFGARVQAASLLVGGQLRRWVRRGLALGATMFALVALVPALLAVELLAALF
jgi:hypothetical protein